MVSAAQAGSSISCDCGARLEVPQYSDLRKLEVARELVQKTRRYSWEFKNAVGMAGLLLMALGIGLGVYTYKQEVAPYINLAILEKLQSEENIQKLPPAQLWPYWQHVNEDVIGLADEFSDVSEIESRGKLWVGVWLGLAAFGLLCALGGFFLPGAKRRDL